MIFSILITIIAVSVFAALLMVIKSFSAKKRKNAMNDKVQKNGKNSSLKDAEKKLAKDPHNVSALEFIGEFYYNEKNWDKVWNVYKTLNDISASHIEIDVAKCALRMGISAFYSRRVDDAINSLMTAIKKDPNNFECNLILGKALLEKNIIDKAVYCLKKAKSLMPENNEVNSALGICLFKSQKYKESIQFIKKALEETPDDKELLYDMAVAMSECGMGDNAIKIFMRLRSDPEFGPLSCLESGKMHERAKDYENAVDDYEIALRHQNLNDQLAIQIKYRLGCIYISTNEIAKGLAYLKQVQTMKANYKDTDALISRYGELNQNKNLQAYLLAGPSDFVDLCKKLIAAYFKESFVKVEDVQVNAEFVEIICNAENSKLGFKQLFRFYRSQNVIGDINVREFHGKIRDAKCDHGVCVTVGHFSESAHHFVDGRAVTLIEKEELVRILKKIAA